MKKTSLLMPLFKKIDKIFFGIEDFNEIEKKTDLVDSVNEDNFDIEETVI